MNTAAARKVLSLVVLTLFVLTVFLAIGSSSKGAVLLGLEKEIRNLEEENTKLTAELISRTSLTQLSEQQESLGLILPEKVLYLSQTQVALKP